MIVAYIIMIICVRSLYVISKTNYGKMKCKGIFGRILAHSFIGYYNDRVCSICGLVQKEEPAGMLLSEGDAWYDKGYAENKETLIQYYLDQKLCEKERDRKWEEEQKNKTMNTRINTPSVDTHEKRSTQ